MMFVIGACGSKQECMPPPPSITFRLQDTFGKDVSIKYVTNLNVSYVDKGQNKNVDVKTSIDGSQNKASFFSYFPSLAGGGISNFTLALNDGSTYPVEVTLGPKPDNCTSAIIQRIQFNGKTVEPDKSIQPITYIFALN